MMAPPLNALAERADRAMVTDPTQSWIGVGFSSFELSTQEGFAIRGHGMQGPGLGILSSHYDSADVAFVCNLRVKKFPPKTRACSGFRYFRTYVS